MMCWSILSPKNKHENFYNQVLLWFSQVLALPWACNFSPCANESASSRLKTLLTLLSGRFRVCIGWSSIIWKAFDKALLLFDLCMYWIHASLHIPISTHIFPAVSVGNTADFTQSITYPRHTLPHVCDAVTIDTCTSWAGHILVYDWEISKMVEMLKANSNIRSATEILASFSALSFLQWRCWLWEISSSSGLKGF